MALNLKTIEENIEKAKEELAFWQKADALLRDPRIATIVESDPESAFHASRPMRQYGELKRRVYETLPEADQDGLTTNQIADLLIEHGYVFSAANPPVAVNEALNALGIKARIAMRRGIAKVWTKGPAEPEADTGAGMRERARRALQQLEDQQQTPP